MYEALVMKLARGKRRFAFTLIELLVVIVHYRDLGCVINAYAEPGEGKSPSHKMHE